MTDKKSEIPGFAEAFQKARESMEKQNEIPQAAEAIQDFPGRYAVPAFTNQFYLSLGPQTTRLTFGEYAFNGQIPNWHYTTVMTTPVALDLARKIFQIARDQGVPVTNPLEPDVLG